jgi:hypothetical protein
LIILIANLVAIWGTPVHRKPAPPRMIDSAWLAQQMAKKDRNEKAHL